jgi:hypothetical protein
MVICFFVDQTHSFLPHTIRLPDFPSTKLQTKKLLEKWLAGPSVKEESRSSLKFGPCVSRCQDGIRVREEVMSTIRILCRSVY